MYLYLKYILTFTFLLHTLYAEEVFIDKNNISLAHITHSYTYCKQTTPYHTLCINKELTYIDYDDSELPLFLNGLKHNILPIINSYKSHHIKTSILENIKDFNSDISGNWNESQSVDLFAQTPTTYTLSTMSNGYTGGAHGYHSMAFTNYAIDTQKPLQLDDIFIEDYNTTLIAVAQKYYKYTHGLKDTQSLQDDGWFENKFVLAENIAITTLGLYFYYNSYEIKSYADGHTRFLLPYSKLRNIIDPQGVLGFF